MKTTPLRNNKALTLAETVIAMMIAAVILVGFLYTCNTSSFMLTDIKYRLRAINIASAQIEDLKSDGYIENANRIYTESVVIDEGPTSSSDDDVLGIMTTRIKEVTHSPDRGNKIVVEIAWNIRGQAKGDSLETVIYEH